MIRFGRFVIVIAIKVIENTFIIENFNKIKYSAASYETHLSDQHVEVVKPLLYSEFLVTELEALSLPTR